METQETTEGFGPPSDEVDLELPEDEVQIDAEEPDRYIDDYDILSSPNDWNVKTIVDYMGTGAIKIPGFQRNYVWDQKRASKLIESLLVGLPVPQIFLYEEARNSFLVIDGQQRLLSIYFFLHGRFPRQRSRGYIGSLLRDGKLSPAELEDDEHFQDFKLSLRNPNTHAVSRFHLKKYKTLGDSKSTLDLRTLRNVVVKQLAPHGHTAMFEIFNRLNTGGANLTAQEIRASLYHSLFMTALYDLNQTVAWRSLLGKDQPDTRMKDVELLLRTLALSEHLDHYSNPMSVFLNEYSALQRHRPEDEVAAVVGSAEQLISNLADLGAAAFQRGGRFSPLLFETTFSTLWRSDDRSWRPTAEDVQALSTDERFVASLQEGSTKKVNLEKRMDAAKEIFYAL